LGGRDGQEEEVTCIAVAGDRRKPKRLGLVGVGVGQGGRNAEGEGLTCSCHGSAS